MFDKKSKPHTDLLGKTNRIVEGTMIKGDIVSEADFRLDGKLIGNFQSKGKIVIGLEGSIIGEINCVNADIEGNFKGKIYVTELLNIKENASIEGEVTVGKLAVEPGATFTATCKMITNSKSSITDGGESKSEETKQ